MRRGCPRTLADAYEGRRLRNGVGGEVVQLHAVVVAQTPHELTGGGVESPLMKVNEAHHVPLRGLRLLMMRRENDPCRPARVGVGHQLPAVDEPLEGVRGHVGPVPRPNPEVLNHGWGGSGERV
jgi:hypothetical protein